MSAVLHCREEAIESNLATLSLSDECFFIAHFEELKLGPSQRKAWLLI